MVGNYSVRACVRAMLIHDHMIQSVQSCRHETQLSSFDIYDMEKALRGKSN